MVRSEDPTMQNIVRSVMLDDASSSIFVFVGDSPREYNPNHLVLGGHFVLLATSITVLKACDSTGSI